MLPPEMESIANEMTKRFISFLEEDEDCLKIPDLLTAEEDVGDFVHKVALGMLRAFVDVRMAQSNTDRRMCKCGRTPGTHKITTWTRETPFGPVTVHCARQRSGKGEGGTPMVT